MAFKPTTLSVPEGGTGVQTITNHGIILGQGTSPIVATAVGATGTVLTGTGVDPAFSATPSVTSITIASGTALGNFVETTWTPVLTLTNPGSSSIAQTPVARYTRIGNSVFFNFRIPTGAFSLGSGSGNVIITGLPFASANVTDQNFYCTVLFQSVTFGAAVSWYTGEIVYNTSQINLMGNRTTTTALPLDAAALGASMVFSGEGWYSVA